SRSPASALIRSSVCAAQESFAACLELFLSDSASSLDLLFRRQRSRSVCTLRSHSEFSVSRTTVEFTHPLMTSLDATTTGPMDLFIVRSYRSREHASRGRSGRRLDRLSSATAHRRSSTQARQRPRALLARPAARARCLSP